MKKMLFLLAVLCFLLAACGSPNSSETIAVPTVAETEPPLSLTEPVQPPADAPAEAPVSPVVRPLPVTLDISNLDNCTVAVSLEQGDAYYGSGITQIPTMRITVYTYDLYDIVDIATLSGGDTILIRGSEVIVEALDRAENGDVLINGGLDMGGYELRTDENTVYYETGYSDIKSWYELGTAELEVSENFVFTDSSDLDQEPVTYTFDDLVSQHETLNDVFGPQSTTVIVENGYIISMERVYTP